MKLIHLSVIMLLGMVTLQAQNTLTGTITSQETQEAITATVYLPQLEKGVLSNLDGSFIIENIPDGSYNLVVSALGFATYAKKIDFSEEELITETIVLSESAVEMKEVIISAPFHKLQSENVMKVERLAMDNLSAQGAITLSDGITGIPGVSSISTGLGIGKPVIRGLSSNRVLTYAQGVRLENQQFGDEHGLGVSDSGIESVEVIKGPASLLYGSDALGGVLYINPEKFAPAGQTHIDGNTSYLSNTNGFKGNAGVQFSGEKLKLLTRFGYVTHSDYETGNDLRVTNSRFNETDFKTGLRYQTAKLKSTLRYNYNIANVGIPEEIGEQTSRKGLDAPFQAIDNHILSLDNSYFFSNSSLNLKIGYLHNDRREFEEEEEVLRTTGDPPPALQLKLNTINYDLKYHLPDFGKFETIVGSQGMFQTNKNFGEEYLIPNAETTDFGIFGTTHYHLEKIDIQGGLRFDRRNIVGERFGLPSDDGNFPAFDKSFNSFNAALGVKVNLNETIQTRLNLASGFRAPNLAELASNGVHEGTNRYELGNLNLKNEQNLQVDISADYTNEHFEFFANGFLNYISDYIFISPTGDVIEDAIVYEYVQQNATLYGGELGMHIHPHPLDWLHLESSFESVIGKLQDSNYLPLIPANQLKNTIRVELNNGKLFLKPTAFLSLTNTFSQKNVSSFETETKGYNLLAFGTQSDFKFRKLDVRLSLSITNITNETYVAHLSRLKIDGIPNIGRSINFNMKVAL